MFQQKVVYNMDSFNIVDYLNAITSEHRDKENYIQLVSATLQPLIDLNHCISDFNYFYALDTAEGKQLDMLGALMGITRETEFALEDGTNQLQDEDFRMYIKSKTAQNFWDGTLDGLMEVWGTIFPTIPLNITDNQDMSCMVVISSEFFNVNQISLLFNNMLIPKPAGVEYSYFFADRIIFAFDLDTTLFKGWDEGFWGGERENTWSDVSSYHWVGLNKFTWFEVLEAKLF